MGFGLTLSRREASATSLKSQKANNTTGCFTMQRDLQGRANADSRIGRARADYDRNAFSRPAMGAGQGAFRTGVS